MKNITQSLKIITLTIVLSFGLPYAYAWVAPTATPPGSNASAPINVSTTAQYKGGAFGVGGLLRGYGNAIFDGSVGIGTTTPWALLHVTGAPNVRTFAGIIAESSNSTGAPGFCATSAPGSHVYGCMVVWVALEQLVNLG